MKNDCPKTVSKVQRLKSQLGEKHSTARLQQIKHANEKAPKFPIQCGDFLTTGTSPSKHRLNEPSSLFRPEPEHTLSPRRNIINKVSVIHNQMSKTNRGLGKILTSFFTQS